jgi:hypothetical protein
MNTERVDIKLQEKFGNYDYIKGTCNMARINIEPQYERNQVKSKLPSGFGQKWS